MPVAAKCVLPANVSIVDDPTAKQFGGQDLLGTYAVDEEGVKAERVNAFNPALAPPDLETPLELQDQQDGRSIYALGQIFALDGDSIMLAANRNRVVKVQNARGRNRTPLVLGKRELADAEFWTYTNGFGTRPTGGFVRVSQVNHCFY